MTKLSKLLYVSLVLVLAGPAALQAASPGDLVSPVTFGATVTPVGRVGPRLITPLTPPDEIVTPVAVAPAPLPPQIATTGPANLPLQKAERIVVIKHLRIMELVRDDGYVMASYSVRLGHHPVGAKTMRGDGRTPEGVYSISGRDEKSLFTLALHVSYPNAADRERAHRLHVDPGGSIEIHGDPIFVDKDDIDDLKQDWTAGCIALSNADIQRVWEQVDDGTLIDIRP